MRFPPDEAHITVEVTCRDPHGDAVRHRVYLSNEGVFAPDHEGESWGEAEFVEIAMGQSWMGPAQPCLHLLGLLPDVSIGLAAEPPGVPYSRGKGDSRVMDFSDWVVLDPGGSELMRARLRGFAALNIYPPAEEYTAQPTLASMHAMLVRLLRLGGYRVVERVNGNALAEALIHPEEVAALTRRGLPWQAAHELLTTGLDVEGAFSVWSSLANDPGFVRDRWYGGAAATVDYLLDMGVQIDRLPGFLRSRSIAIGFPSGLKPEAMEILRGKVAGGPGDRSDWLSEVSASLPAARNAAHVYSGGNRAQVIHHVADFERLGQAYLSLFLDEAAARLNRGIDPQTWGNDWMWVPLDEIMSRVYIPPTQEDPQ